MLIGLNANTKDGSKEKYLGLTILAMIFSFALLDPTMMYSSAVYPQKSVLEEASVSHN